jgi:ElaB/YqjD/DUF883 family membrane-anchored ribosome-binding protein
MDLRSERRRLAADVEILIMDVNRLLEALGSQASAEAGDAMRSRLADMKQRLDGIEQGAIERARYAAHATDEYVHDHPWTVLGVAIGTALLVGALLGRRR